MDIYPKIFRCALARIVARGNLGDVLFAIVFAEPIVGQRIIDWLDSPLFSGDFLCLSADSDVREKAVSKTYCFLGITLRFNYIYF